jgi:hypothetical protein
LPGGAQPQRHLLADGGALARVVTRTPPADRSAAMPSIIVMLPNVRHDSGSRTQ